ncbi:MAG: hypothetical protein ACKOA8_16885, partial [Deltaproteobacteria bacterium]
MNCTRLDKQGSILVEALLGLGSLLLAILLLCEVYRREVYQVVLAHITCMEVRELALGESRLKVHERVREFLRSSLGKETSIFWERQTQVADYWVTDLQILRQRLLGRKPGLVSERWLRYPQLS